MSAISKHNDAYIFLFLGVTEDQREKHQILQAAENIRFTEVPKIHESEKKMKIENHDEMEMFCFQYVVYHV